jgi:mRNA-degrading endonuclease RelE of RelBE toxin-antitoxin system
MEHRIKFAVSVLQQMDALRRGDRVRVLRAVAVQLVHEPLVETRNRKQLRPNPLAPWELRLGELRVFYQVADEDPRTVRILAVGRKVGDRLYIGGQEVVL